LDNSVILSRSHGVKHGPITRLISPDGLGDRLKPFIFLDFFDADVTPGFGFGMHPHSGIATLTWQPGCDVQYRDTTGNDGILKAGGLEWMLAGGGAWHQGTLLTKGHATGFQLWVPLPPGVEDGPSFGLYIPPSDVGSLQIEGGQIKVFLGSVSTKSFLVTSPITSHQNMNYFSLFLEAGAQWTYETPVAHDVGFVFAFEGEALVNTEKTSKELIELRLPGPVLIAAQDQPVRVLCGSALKHDYPLMLGTSSVHTNETSLRHAVDRIRAIGNRLESNPQNTRM